MINQSITQDLAWEILMTRHRLSLLSGPFFVNVNYCVLLLLIVIMLNGYLITLNIVKPLSVS